MIRTAALALTFVLVISIGGCSKNRMDITMEGPWILHPAKVVDKDGARVSVLIAIAPVNAVADDVSSDPHMHFHHLPQLTSGDGFYVNKDFLTQTHIFCVTFNGVCAPMRADSPTTEPYPDFKFIQMNSRPREAWNWVDASQNQATFILPMPDSWSADGIWNEKFKDNKNNTTVDDDTFAIGIHLHYKSGIKSVTLMGCKFDSPSTPTSACSIELSYNGKSAPELTNTGTLRLDMKAPDTKNTCDYHVRYAWDAVYQILGPIADPKYQQIDPAQTIENGKGVYDKAKCDPQPETAQPPQENVNLLTSRTSHSTPGTTGQRISLDLFRQLVTSLGIAAAAYSGDLPGQDDWLRVKNLEAQLDSFNPNFPRISQSVLIADLTREPIDFSTLEKPFLNDAKVLNALEQIKNAVPALAADPGTKNGGDCRAPLVIVP